MQPGESILARCRASSRVGERPVAGLSLTRVGAAEGQTVSRINRERSGSICRGTLHRGHRETALPTPSLSASSVLWSRSASATQRAHRRNPSGSPRHRTHELRGQAVAPGTGVAGPPPPDGLTGPPRDGFAGPPRSASAGETGSARSHGWRPPPSAANNTMPVGTRGVNRPPTPTRPTTSLSLPGPAPICTLSRHGAYPHPSFM